MAKPALAAAALVLLGGAWWYMRRAAATNGNGDASSSNLLSFDAPVLQDFAASFDLSSLTGALTSIEGTAQAAFDDVVSVVTPTPNAERNVAAFCTSVRLGEGTSDANGYRRLFGGQLFDSYADHPRIRVPFHNSQKPGAGMNDYTTAAGAYQALSTTWDDFVRSVGPRDFSPASQDEFAVWCIRRRGALTDVKAGRFDVAIAKCAKEWASLPGSPYGQPTVTLAAARAVYEGAGGIYG